MLPRRVWRSQRVQPRGEPRAAAAQRWTGGDFEGAAVRAVAALCVYALLVPLFARRPLRLLADAVREVRAPAAEEAGA